MDNLIVSGNGKGHKTNVILRIVIALLIGGAATVVAISNMGLKLEDYDGPGARRFYMVYGVILLYVCIYCCIYVWLHILKTEINVYENGIKGKSIDVDFYSIFSLRRDNGNVKMSEFHVDYDQISSVKCMGKSVIIKTASKNHKCYAMNAKEIRDVILKQKNENNM